MSTNRVARKAMHYHPTLLPLAFAHVDGNNEHLPECSREWTIQLDTRYYENFRFVQVRTCECGITQYRCPVMEDEEWDHETEWMQVLNHCYALAWHDEIYVDDEIEWPEGESMIDIMAARRNWYKMATRHLLNI